MHPYDSPLQQKILTYLRNKSHVSFVELCRDIPEVDGDREWHVPGRNLVLWSGLSEEAVYDLQDLLDRGKIDIKSTSVLTYIIDGAYCSYPLAKQVKRPYKKPHWYPIVLNPI